ncbi:hypothetical protein [Streptomyces sp. 769]|uniref:hypothetical protein n=1 Tax=Streptomyces sp. 769 TaxID=1262452 RepID=UPI0005809967|nr:hypothetical protein [Streptomyces sp. 769]AJC58617.1 hypothetical protein GZL_06044 [Streptomyces sp. 769]
MNDLGTEVEATATWLEQHNASGAATLLRRVASQRERARRELDAHRTPNRYRLAWRSARRRARTEHAKFTSISEQLDDFHSKWGEDCRRFNEHSEAQTRACAQLRTDLAQFQVHAERAGWIPDPAERRLWRWREDWWELAHRKKNPEDGYPDTGWYLWGPTESGHFGQWTGRLTKEATTEADRLITKYLTTKAATS